MMKLTMAAALAALTLAACDNSPQSADGAVAEGDVGVAAATTNGALADTGKDTGNMDIGGAGEATGGDETGAQTNATTNTQTTDSPSP